MASVVLRLKLTWSYGWTSNQSASIQWIRLMPEMLGNLPKLDRFFFFLLPPAHIYFFFSSLSPFHCSPIFSLTVSTVSYRRCLRACVCILPPQLIKRHQNVLNAARVIDILRNLIAFILEWLLCSS